MTGNERPNALRRSAEEQRDSERESIALTRVHLDRWREHVRQRYFDAWLDETARKLGRPRETVRLLDVTETYAVQDADMDSDYLYAIGQLPRFVREVPFEQRAEVERLIDKIRTRLPDTPIYILRGTTGFWMTADEDEPSHADAWGNASSYFGAVEATSDEVLAHAAVWLDKDDFVNTFISAVDARDSLSLMVGKAYDISLNGLSCALCLCGPTWGRLLSNE